MDERCTTAHARLLAGTCPWCGQSIFNGRVIDHTQARRDLEPIAGTIPDMQIEILGPSLKHIVEQDGPLDWQRAARYIAEVSRQLGELHCAQQVHRDVRPNNIYLTQSNSAELGDEAREFAHASFDEESIPSIVDCLAPEQVLNSQAVDGRADIYSLGCTLYFLLAGHMPFPSGSIAERLLKHQTATPESLSALQPKLPTAIVQVCERMMAKKPNDRYATAKDVIDALARIESEG